jgi:hypothetical protein
MRETKIRITDWVQTPDGLGQVSMFDKNATAETLVKVHITAPRRNRGARWYKLTEIKL